MLRPEDPQEPALTSLDAGPTPTSHGVGRPSKVAAFRPAAIEVLAEEPALATIEALCRLRSRGYDGGKSAVYDLVKSLRPTRAEPPMVRFEAFPGECSQHDFGTARVTYAEGTKEAIHFFASRLKFSRWAGVRVVAAIEQALADARYHVDAIAWLLEREARR